MAEEQGLGLGKLAQPLRAALTGQTTSPGIFDVLVLLGRDESLARIDAQATPSGVASSTDIRGVRDLADKQAKLAVGGRDISTFR